MTTTVKIQACVNEGRVIEVVTEDLSFGWCRTNILRDGERLEATVYDWQMVRVREADESDAGAFELKGVVNRAIGRGPKDGGD